MAEWAECSATCGAGQRIRAVQCVDSSGEQAEDGSCPGDKPSESATCNTQPCDFCASTTCLGRGTCTSGACSCRDGYSGAFCETAPSCKSGLVDSTLQCCVSGVVDAAGACCPEGSSLDGAGQCCAGQVDACGSCGGSALLIDMRGTCCGVADANGVCCESGAVDECGVCDGMGNTCGMTVTTTLVVPASLVSGSSVEEASINEYVNNTFASLGLDPQSVSVGDISLAAPSGRRRRRLAQEASDPTLGELYRTQAQHTCAHSSPWQPS